MSANVPQVPDGRDLGPVCFLWNEDKQKNSKFWIPARTRLLRQLLLALVKQHDPKLLPCFVSTFALMQKLSNLPVS